MPDNYLTASIKASLTIAGVQFDDVISVSATFALNTIPTASVVVAVGFAGNGPGATGDGAATIHKFKEYIKPRAEASIFVEIGEVSGTQIGITPGLYKVFEGYVAGFSYQRSHNHANYSINLIHWLDDLNNSSAINGNWFPGVPHDWAQQATYDLVNSTTNTNAVTPSVTRGLANAANAKQDLWGKIIKPVMSKVAGFSAGVEQKRYPPDRDSIWQSNAAAEKALQRMPGKSPNPPPLTLQINDAGINADNTIAEFFTRQMGESFAQNSFWAKILEFAGQFLFAISPAVDWATPIPFCAGLKFGGAAKKITAKEYSYANFNANMSQLLEGVYVYHPVASATSFPNTVYKKNMQLSFYQLWGRYPDKPQKGLKLFKNAPAWLGNLGPATLAGLNSATHVQDFATRRDGTALPTGVALTAEAHKAQNNTVKRFAQHWYYTEILQQRYGELAGPLRFDIAPGSIVKIETPIMEKELGDKNPWVVASVISVSYMINAERATAGTSFTIAHTKTEEEHSDELYSTDKAPMYEQAWHGGPLQLAE